jgi:hypothetical protein
MTVSPLVLGVALHNTFLAAAVIVAVGALMALTHRDRPVLEPHGTFTGHDW